ncbi:MAG: hypothetical protein ACXADU_12200 [Promethearchaeota archaeon]
MNRQRIIVIPEYSIVVVFTAWEEFFSADLLVDLFIISAVL